jgi:hypothetical protein
MLMMVAIRKMQCDEIIVMTKKVLLSTMTTTKMLTGMMTTIKLGIIVFILI